MRLSAHEHAAGLAGAGPRVVGEPRPRVRRGRGGARPSRRGHRSRRSRVRDPPRGPRLPARRRRRPARASPRRSRVAAGSATRARRRVAGLLAALAQRDGSAREARPRCCATRPTSRATPTTPPRRCTAVSSPLPAGMSSAFRSRGCPQSSCGSRTVRRATASARRLLPDQVPFDDAVFNVGRTALLVAALAAGDVDALRTATEDRLHQDRRLARVPDSRARWMPRSTPARGARGCRARGRRSPRSPTRRTGARRRRGAAGDGRAHVLAIDDEGATDLVKLEGTCVVVTGAAGGIGKALARRFLREGARVVVVSDVAGGRARRAAAEIGATAIAVRRHRRSRDPRAHRPTEAEHGPIDLFCSNAGVARPRRRRCADRRVAAQLRRQRDGARLRRRAILVPRMLERGGGYLLQTASAAGCSPSSARRRTR